MLRKSTYMPIYYGNGLDQISVHKSFIDAAEYHNRRSYDGFSVPASTHHITKTIPKTHDKNHRPVCCHDNGGPAHIYTECLQHLVVALHICYILFRAQPTHNLKLFIGSWHNQRIDDHRC